MFQAMQMQSTRTGPAVLLVLLALLALSHAVPPVISSVTAASPLATAGGTAVTIQASAGVELSFVM